MADPTQVNRRRGSPKLLGLTLLAVVILLPSAAGFGTKLLKFVKASGSGEGGFAILPLLVYLSVAAGFLCLLAWAMFQGMFKDVERPKFTMLENEERLEQSGHGAG